MAVEPAPEPVASPRRAGPDLVPSAPPPPPVLARQALAVPHVDDVHVLVDTGSAIDVAVRRAGALAWAAHAGRPELRFAAAQAARAVVPVAQAAVPGVRW